MSVFEQCIPYMGLEKDLTCDVLEDDEDILTQISAQLDIPSFVDQEVSGCFQPVSGSAHTLSSGSSLPRIEGLESGMLDDVLMDDFTSLSGYPDSGYSDASIKSEPSSPSSSQDHSPPLSPVQNQSYNIIPNNINTILTKPFNSTNNSVVPGKVAIPKLSKPVVNSSTVTSVGQVPVTATNQPVFLVCNQQTNNGPIFVKTEAVSPGFSNPLVTGLPTVSSHSSAEELRNLKRQQRMIKNRESACISRKKKKEYVTQLEEQIKTLSSENQLLRNENENLKEKLRDLQADKSLWTDSIVRNGNGKKATALLAMLFMVSLNLSSLGSIYNAGDVNVETKLGSNVHQRDTGRTLLWVSDEEGETDHDYLANVTSSGHSQCGGANLNTTESIRLESDLRGWFNVEPPVVRRRPDITRKPTKRPLKKKAVRNFPVGHVVKSPLHSLTGSVYHMLLQEPSSNNKNALSFYSNSRKNSFASFFDAIERRDDTFYVVSFSGDHLLVPATNHSKQSQPLMSLMLPAVLSSNSTENQSDTIAMMKIDCQVINTQLVHIMKDAIPVHMASNLKNNKTEETVHQQDDKVFSSNFKRSSSSRTRKTDNLTVNSQANLDSD